jgi:hypothetical protein
MMLRAYMNNGRYGIHNKPNLITPIIIEIVGVMMVTSYLITFDCLNVLEFFDHSSSSS